MRPLNPGTAERTKPWALQEDAPWMDWKGFNRSRGACLVMGNPVPHCGHSPLPLQMGLWVQRAGIQVNRAGDLSGKRVRGKNQSTPTHPQLIWGISEQRRLCEGSLLALPLVSPATHLQWFVLCAQGSLAHGAEQEERLFSTHLASAL